MSIEKLENKASFIKTFIDKLGDVSEWEHNGVVIDAGKGSKEKCVCGHRIRYLFIIEKGDKTTYVGSECINHFKDYNINLYNSLNASIQRIKEEEKQQIENMKKKEIEEIKNPYEEMVKIVYNWYRTKYPGWCSNYHVWKFVSELYIKPKKNYKNIGSLLSWYKKNMKNVSEFVTVNNIA